jgi:two-component system, chemotaxis family, CheB/CheR fusion protein
MPVVGVGASAGGLAALEAFFSGLPPSPGMAFIVVVHLLPEVESQLAELLQRNTGLTVLQVNEEALLEVDHVYVIPPDHNLGSLDGKVELLPRRESGRNRAPIDLLMASLAETHGDRSAGVILSGTGSDGAVGLRRIREAGGISMVQDPEEAAFPEMLRAALRSGVVDAVLPASQLGPELVRLFHTELQGIPEAGGESEESLDGILRLLREHVGRDFTGYKEATLQRRIRRRLPLAGCSDLEEYRAHLGEHPDEVEHLAADMLIGVTRFFRDPEVFRALSEKVITPLVSRAGEGDDIRAWVAGCSTGEEAYTLAILLAEAQRDRPPVSVRIFATDIDPVALEVARNGLYPQGIALDVPPELLKRYFTLEAGGYRVRKELKERLLFATHDLLSDPPFSSLDLVLCRNVLIYLKPGAQERVLGLFRYSLRERGHLLLGTAETADQVPNLFAAVDPRHRIYRALPLGNRALSRVLPTPPPGAPALEFHTPHPSPVKPSSRRSPGLLHHDLVELYAPPSLVVTEDLVVIHLSESVWRYLRLRGGEPFSSLPDLLPDEMAGEVRILMEEAMRTLKTVTGSVLRLESGEEIRLVIRPHRPAGGGTFALVVFEPASGPGKEGAAQEAGDAEELASVRLQLRQAFEAHDRTLQEYRTAYAELQAINEEQKVTGEELESSKEELQSVNEELRTINQEHREKIEELARLNADLKNLIDSAEVALIFLDRELRIRRFTPAVADIFRFRAADLGRPVGEITSTLRYPRLVADALQVLEDEKPVRRELEAEDDRWYMVQMVPYRSFAGGVEGVVATFLEVTGRKRSEAEMERLLGEARRAEMARSNLFGMLAHEFRQPLGVLEEAARALDPERSDPAGRVLAEQVVAVTGRVRRMLDEMLDGREERGGTHTTGVDATRVITETVELLRARASDQGVRLVCRVETSLPATSTDGWRLHRLTSHLVENALEVTGSGEVVVHLQADPPWLVLEVMDGGPPLPPPILDWLSGRDREEPALPRGRDQRLRAIRELAEMASGRLEVSCPGEAGCRYRVHLPLPTPD